MLWALGILLLMLAAYLGFAENGRAYVATFYFSSEIIKASRRSATKEELAADIGDLYKVWSAKIFSIFSIELGVKEGANLPSGNCVYLCNHQSSFDIPALVTAIPSPVSFVAKKELSKVPIFGEAMRRAGTVFVDRSNRQASVAALEEAVPLLRTCSVIAFPEGTRSKTGIKSFKKGVFHLAAAAGATVVPVAIAGSDDINALDPQRRLIRLKFGEPFTLDPSKRVDIEAVVVRVRREILELNKDIGGRGAATGMEESHVSKGAPPPGPKSLAQRIGDNLLVTK